MFTYNILNDERRCHGNTYSNIQINSNAKIILLFKSLEPIVHLPLHAAYEVLN